VSTGIIAVADLGSNSFKLEIAQVKNGRPKIIERIRKNVKLGGGVGPTNMLTKPAMRAGWEALAEFGDRLTGFDPKNVKVIATQTLRSVKNAAEFLD
jgi:exopolyphosphatase / guanosine-5'-triphosphate,3'-diphosphate pyrophosphatase